MTIQETYRRWVERADTRYAEELRELGQDAQAMKDAFYQDLAFGTGGLRGILGAGSNRMNIHTVGKATQGLADYLNANFTDPSVAIARDSRNNGELFVQTAAGVLAANGIKAYLYPRIEPTPALSFAVRDLGCSAGICMTASHNPAAYSGYKAYGPDGCQITTQAARDIQAAIGAVDAFDNVKAVPFQEALDSGMAQWIGEDTLDRFIDAVAQQSLGSATGTAGAGAAGTAGEGGEDAKAEGAAAGAAGAAAGASGAATEAAAPELSVVYTPLNGTGLECVGRILERVGISDVTVVPEQAQPDGNFPTCPYPNPEIREALQCGLDLCEQAQPDLLLATDPDADRVGIAVRHDGAYELLTGNEVGILLLDFVCAQRAARGEDLSRGVAVTTIVSTSMVDALAEHYGFELRRTLTGFKYIGEQIGLLEAAGQADRFLFGFEESYGYLAGTHVRDKDAVVASMLICQMAQHYKVRGLDLVDAMDALYKQYGYYKNGLISLEYPGADGAQKMDSIMERLRTAGPAEIAGLEVQGFVDYGKGVPMPVAGGAAGDAPGKGATGAAGESADAQMLPPASVLEFQLAGGSKVLVRPSGTEPKIKAYLFAQAAEAPQATGLLARLDAATRELLQ